EELFVDRAGRADDAMVVVGVDDVGGADDRQDGGARGDARDGRAAAGVGGGDGALPVREEAELDDVFGTGVLAVEAHVAFVLAPLHAALRAVCALAVD